MRTKRTKRSADSPTSAALAKEVPVRHIAAQALKAREGTDKALTYLSPVAGRVKEEILESNEV